MADLPLKEMSLSEKIIAIEMIWDDITHTVSDFSSPKWHKDILEERDEKLDSGEEKLFDWEIAKNRLK